MKFLIKVHCTKSRARGREGEYRDLHNNNKNNKFYSIFFFEFFRHLTYLQPLSYPESLTADIHVIVVITVFKKFK